jgi:hypothetical protein
MAVFLGFSAEIQGINYLAVAIFKLDDGAAFWNGDHPTSGHLTVFDLVQKKQHWVSGSFGIHGSRHRNGTRHQALEPAGHRKIYISPYMDTAATDLASDSHIRTVHVPLLQGFEWWPIKTPLWDAIATTSRHVLQREDFGERVDGVILQGFMCRHACVDDLLARWRRTAYRWWVEPGGEFDLIVLAEVVRVPMPQPAEPRCVAQ